MFKIKQMKTRCLLLIFILILTITGTAQTKTGKIVSIYTFSSNISQKKEAPLFKIKELSTIYNTINNYSFKSSDLRKTSAKFIVYPFFSD